MENLKNKYDINKEDLSEFKMLNLLKDFGLSGHFERIKKVDNKFLIALTENHNAVSFQLDLDNKKENVICIIDNSPFFYAKLVFDDDFNGIDEHNTTISINRFVNNKISRMSFSLDDNNNINDFVHTFIELVVKRNNKLISALMNIKKYYNKRNGDDNEKTLENAN